MLTICDCEKPDRVVCGTCGNAWCQRCDPAPGPLCHWCNGRGHSTAPLTPDLEIQDMREMQRDMRAQLERMPQDKVDGMVRKAKANEAALLNSSGRDAQIAYLLGE